VVGTLNVPANQADERPFPFGFQGVVRVAPFSNVDRIMIMVKDQTEKAAQRQGLEITAWVESDVREVPDALPVDVEGP
jgi:hypothetical protein